MGEGTAAWLLLVVYTGSPRRSYGGPSTSNLPSRLESWAQGEPTRAGELRGRLVVVIRPICERNEKGCSLVPIYPAAGLHRPLSAPKRGPHPQNRLSPRVFLWRFDATTQRPPFVNRGDNLDAAGYPGARPPVQEDGCHGSRRPWTGVSSDEVGIPDHARCQSPLPGPALCAAPDRTLSPPA